MSRKSAEHAPRPDLPVVDNELQIGGMSVTRLARSLGGTPFYAYDRALLDRRVALLRETMPADLKLHYAIKANPMPALVQHMARRVDGLDVASGGEMRVALDSGTPSREISFAGPGKTDAEIAQAMAAGLTLNVESPREIAVATQVAERTGEQARIAVRVNPGFELRSSGMQMGGGPKVFGIDEERVPEVVRAALDQGHEFVGFHIYCGSQNLREEALIEAQAKSLELGVRLAQGSGAELRSLNIGGGLGIPYFPGETPLDPAIVGAALAEQMARHAGALAGAQVIMELGRYLVGEAGYYVCRVLERKVSRGETFLVTDGGLHHHLAASGNFGQVIRKNYPVLVANRVTATETEIVDVVGPLCTPLDLLARRMTLPAAREGDLIAVLQSGAYGLSASPRAFLGHPDAREALV